MAFRKIIYFVLVLILAVSVFIPTAAFAWDDYKNKDPLKYYVLLDIKNQFITVYEKDAKGEYTKIVRRLLCSTGKPAPKVLDPTKPADDPANIGMPTPKGIWKSGGHERFGLFTAYGEYARYWTQVVDDIYFHSVLFKKRDVNGMTGGSYGSLGNPVSHGCVRLYVEDAKWIYYNIPPGTTIKVSTTEPSQPAIRKALKSTLSFAQYKVFQANIYDDPESPNPHAWVVVDGAAILSASGSNGKTRAKLKVGDEVEVLLWGDPWLKVKYNNREGYIKTGYVTFEKGVMQSKQDADIIKGTVWMYAKPNPGKDDDGITKVPTDSSVKILEPDNNGWTKIKYWDCEGYIETKALRKGWGVIRE